MANTLKIVSGNATPTNVVVYFSEPLDTSNLTKGAGTNDPSLPANYTVQLQGGGAQPAVASVVYDAINNASVIQLNANPALTRGQWLSVAGSEVAAASDINHPGTDPFFFRINGDDRIAETTKQSVRAAEAAVTYPLLTEQVSFPRSGGGPTTGVSSSPGGTSLGQTAALAIGDVLGWKVSDADPRGFVGALTQAFTLTDVEGHVESTWKPRTYAVQTDLGGGITGAQASLYTRAKDALDQSLQLLDGLYPLDPEADPEYVKALREMARSQMTEIVTEFGTVGLPSILRIDTYFEILLGQHPTRNFTQVEFDPDKIKGTLGSLRDTYGIYFRGNPFNNSVEDEQDITNFRVISDYMTSLLQSWIANRQFFIVKPKELAFFGTQLVLISRQLNVIAETVNEVRFVLDSVFIGPNERQTLLLEFTDKALPPMFLEDVLVEVENFVTDEGPQLLRDGGKISVTNNIRPVVESLEHMIHQAHDPENKKSLPDGYKTTRVRHSLDDLQAQLRELLKLTKQVEQSVRPPQDKLRLSSIVPVGASLKSGTPTHKNPATIRVSVFGDNFEPGTVVSITQNASALTITKTDFYSAQRIDVTLDLTAGAPPTGKYDVTITNPDDEPAQLLDSFTITP